MKTEKVMTVFVLLLALIILAAFVLFLHAQVENHQEMLRDQQIAEEYSNPASSIRAASLTKNESNTEMDEAKAYAEQIQAVDAKPWEVDLKSLREVNEETVGWIWLPNSEINYPVMMGEDNSYYLNHRFDGTSSKEGAIFIDYRCDLDGNNLVVYGHNTSSGKFDSLLSFLQAGEEYWTLHPYFVFYSEEHPTGIIYDIFSFFRTDVSSNSESSKVYMLADDTDYPEYLEYLQSRSDVDTGIEVSSDRQMIMLSTCSYMSNKRCVVCGIAREETNVEEINP